MSVQFLSVRVSRPMAKKQKTRSRGWAFLTVFTMLFARNYWWAVALVVSCAVVVWASFFLSQQRGQASFTLMALVWIFWFVYGGIRANSWFDNDSKLTETERGMFKKLMDRSGFIVFLMVVFYCVIVAVVAGLGWMLKSKIQDAGMMNSADYEQFLQDLQDSGTIGEDLPIDQQAGIDELGQPSDLPNS